MKIFIISRHFLPHYGGAEFQLDFLARLLVESGHEVEVLTSRLQNSRKIENYQGYKILRFGSGYSKKGKVQAYNEILAYIRKNRDLDWVYWSYSGSEKEIIIAQYELLKYLRHQGVKRIMRVTSSERIRQAKEDYPEFINEVDKVNYIVTLNEGIKEELLGAGVSGDGIIMMNNVVDVAMFKKVSKQEKELLRQKLGFGLDEKIFIYTGRFSPKKNLPLLTTLWYEFGYHLNAEMRLLIVANDNLGIEDLGERQKIESCIKGKQIKNINIIAVKKREELAKLYQLSDVCVNFSTTEGMSNSLLEGMASGLVIMCSNIIANENIVKQNVNGYLFSLDNNIEIKTAFEGAMQKNEQIIENNVNKIMRDHLVNDQLNKLILKII